MAGWRGGLGARGRGCKEDPHDEAGPDQASARYGNGVAAVEGAEHVELEAGWAGEGAG